MAKAEVTVILPGLAAILGQQLNANILPTFLSKIIKQAQFGQDETRLQRLLLNHFSHQKHVGPDLPIAGLSLANSILVTPCYLHPDRDQLLLFSNNLAITDDESQSLIAEIQPLLDDFGGSLVKQRSDSWLLQLKHIPSLDFSALEDVANKGIEQTLPRGEDRQPWLRLWNEIQMQLHDADINKQRVAQGKLPINSIWFWGAGEFFAKAGVWDKVQGCSDLLRLVARASNIELEHSDDFSATSLTSGNHLWLLEELDIENDWQQQLNDIDQNILRPLWESCKAAKLSKVKLQIPDYGNYHFSPIDCWKFWK